MARYLAVDIGGTFIDATVFDESGAIEHEKTPTIEDNIIDGILEAFDSLDVALPEVNRFTHGTTTGLNAVLERDGAKTGLITNEDFTDVLEIGRSQIEFEKRYDIKYQKPEPLVPRRRRVGVQARIDADGETVRDLDDDQVEDVAAELVDEHEVDAIAVCLLHSYENPAHERRIADLIQQSHPEIDVSISSDISREYREYERTSTTAIDAYIKPVFAAYLSRLEAALEEEGFEGSFLITRSGGGAVPASDAADSPINTIFSGPAGGIIGASYIASSIDRDNVISFDMGGTSLDACIISGGDAETTYETTLESFPITTAAYDIRTIGAGGGSIAWHDDSILKVGPRSAGSDPGPICYGWGGTEPTFTDAALQLGYIDEDAFLGGSMTLNGDAARAGLRSKLADPLGMELQDVCTGIFEVAMANTVGTIRELTVEKGLDPRDFSVIAYGGAGPMFAPLVAREMDIDTVVVPRVPSVFSAWGMLLTDLVYDFAQTHITTLEETRLSELDEMFEQLTQQGETALEQEGYDPEDVDLTRELEMRYVGQEHSVEVVVGDVVSLEEVRQRFEESYRARYNHAMDNKAEIVNLRLRAVGTNDTVSLPRIEGGTDVDPTVGSAEAYCFAEDDFVPFDVYDRDRLRSGMELAGPAIVREPSTTIVFFSDQRATVDEYGQLLVE